MYSNFSYFAARVCLSLTLLTTTTTIAEAAPTSLSAEDFIKIRCHTDGLPAYTQWSGNITTSGVDKDEVKTLFKIVGFNVARCYRNNSGNWMVSSRELTYYLDPVTGLVVHNWKNPWTNESVPVIHIANDLVQQPIPAVIKIPVEKLGATAIVRIDVPLSYPNPLGGDARFSDYSPERFYKAHESFSYVVSSAELKDLSAKKTLEDVQVSWTRVSPWMPWMKMKGMPGYVVFNAIVSKVRSFSDLPELIQSDIRERLPLYADAPQCIVTNRANVSSWTYFKENFQAYLTGLQFPLPAPLSLAENECIAP
jgi:hypothetical protein